MRHLGIRALKARDIARFWVQYHRRVKLRHPFKNILLYKKKFFSTFTVILLSPLCLTIGPCCVWVVWGGGVMWAMGMVQGKGHNVTQGSPFLSFRPSPLSLSADCGTGRGLRAKEKRRGQPETSSSYSYFPQCTVHSHTYTVQVPP